MNTRRALAYLPWSTTFAALATICTGGSASAAAPIDVPVHQEVDDFNPCNGTPIHLMYDGTLKIQEFDARSVVHGSVTTSDGYAGSFNWLLMSQRDGDVQTTRLMDMEARPDHSRLRFQLLIHTTPVAGVVKVDHLAISLRCLGKPLP